jgi:hypothetical protein
MDPKEEARQNIQLYLERNKLRLILMSVSYIVIEVRSVVPGARNLSESEVSSLVAVWMSVYGPRISQGSITPPHPASDDGRLLESVKNAVSSVIEGVDIQRGAGKINISVSGLTAELKKGDRSLSIGRSWGGTLGVEVNSGDFHLSGELSSERWEIKLTYPGDTSIPDMSRVGKIFGEGEKAMRGIIKATDGFQSLSDIPKITEAVKPHLQPVKDAVEAVKGIAKAPARGVSFGFSLGSPDPFPEQSGIPKGVQGTVTLTIRF